MIFLLSRNRNYQFIYGFYVETELTHPAHIPNFKSKIKKIQAYNFIFFNTQAYKLQINEGNNYDFLDEQKSCKALLLFEVEIIIIQKLQK